MEAGKFLVKKEWHNFKDYFYLCPKDDPNKCF